MLTFVLFVLSVLRASSALGNAPDRPMLNTPTNLKIGQESNTTAWLQWEFVKPANVSLRDIEFVIWLESRRVKTRKFYHTTEPFEFKFDDLLPAQNYTITMVATSDGWRASQNAAIGFQTMDKDWPTPDIVSVTKSKREELPAYFVVWRSLPSRELTFFEIEVCDRKCKTIKRPTTDNSSRVPVAFNSNFTIRVIACYEVPVVGLFRRHGKYFSGQSGPSPPERLLRSAGFASQVGNRIKLDWHPQFHPTGPTSYYEVFVCDSVSKSFFSSHPVRDDTTTTLRRPILDGSVYELSLADEDDDLGVSELTGAMVSRSAYCKPLPGRPLLLVVILRTSSSVRFRIIFQKGAESFPETKESTHLSLGTGVAEHFGLAAYSPLNYAIRSCVTYGRGGYDRCGNFTTFRILSNTAAPSQVMRVEWRFNDADSVGIYWQEPEDRRGPIDGYQVSIQQTYGASVKTRVVILESSERSYVLKKYNSLKQYKIGIAAFNFDVEQKYSKEMLVGPWLYVEPTEAWLAAVIVWTTLAIALSLVLILIFVTCYRKEDQGEYPPNLDS